MHAGQELNSDVVQPLCTMSVPVAQYDTVFVNLDLSIDIVYVGNVYSIYDLSK